MKLKSFIQSAEKEVKDAVHRALEAGYRHIDTAYSYLNETAIGDVLQEWISSGKIKREELYITTKVKTSGWIEIWKNSILFFFLKLPQIGNHADKVEYFLKLSLQALKLDYVDLYLIHHPVGCCGPKHDKDLYPMSATSPGTVQFDLKNDHVNVWKVNAK